MLPFVAVALAVVSMQKKIPKLAQFLKWDNMAMVQAGQGLKAFSFSWPSAMNCADFALFVGIDIMAGRSCSCAGCAASGGDGVDVAGTWETMAKNSTAGKWRWRWCDRGR